ncbi:MAG: hypothetical protein ABI797_02550, partial [Chloroflexota bacterium]
ENLVLGYPVLIQRAALGFAVAVVLRSQLAGAVIGIALWVGESVLSAILTTFTLARSLGGILTEGGIQPVGPEWYQYLPINIGGNILGALPGTSLASNAIGGGGLQGFILRPVPLDLALPTVLIYMAVAVAAAIVALNRQEIT